MDLFGHRVDLSCIAVAVEGVALLLVAAGVALVVAWVVAQVVAAVAEVVEEEDLVVTSSGVKLAAAGEVDP